jgi:hypothetical protein
MLFLITVHCLLLTEKMVLSHIVAASPEAFKQFVQWLQHLPASLKARSERELLYDFFEEEQIVLNVLGVYLFDRVNYGFNLQFNRRMPQDTITDQFETRWQAEEAGFAQAFACLEHRLLNPELRPN